MILTITMNTSVDITYTVDDFRNGHTNRVKNVVKTAGGKGLNVSRVLHQVQAEVCASGLIGGTTGDYIQNSLDSQNLKHCFYQINQESRNNISIICGKEQTEILEAGPTVEIEEQQQFIEMFKNLLNEIDTVVLSGSLPRGIKSNFYSRLIAIAIDQEKQVLLDTSGEALEESISAPIKPTLIKPNEHELSDLLKEPIDPKNLCGLKNKLSSQRFYRIPWIVVSLGADGALVKHGEEYYHAEVPTIKVMNAIGSGDSVIAGLAFGIDQKESPIDIIKRGMAYGVLNALEEKPGYLKINEIGKIFDQIRVHQI